MGRLALVSGPGEHWQSRSWGVCADNVNDGGEREVADNEVTMITQAAVGTFITAAHLARIRSAPHSLVARLDRHRLIAMPLPTDQRAWAQLLPTLIGAPAACCDRLGHVLHDEDCRFQGSSRR